MKRVLSLLIGAALLVQAFPAEAFAPVSTHYVQNVLDRADRGIAEAESAGSNPDVLHFFFSWLDVLRSSLLATIDTDIRVVQQERDLLENTACLHADLFLIEQKMNEVREKLAEAYESQKSAAMYGLASVLAFLHERHAALLKGARDPSFEDVGWGWRYAFDPAEPVWCCLEEGADCEQKDLTQCLDGGGGNFENLSACGEAGCVIQDQSQYVEDKMCPFHSDYLPPTFAGYGCDLSVMENIADHPPTEAEKEALKTLLEDRDEFLRGRTDLVTLWREIEEALLDPPLPEAKTPVFEQKARRGALSQIAEPPEAFTSDQIEHRARFGCGGKEGDPPPDPEEESARLPGGAIAWELRGPFSLLANELKILVEFLQFRRRWGRAREQADYLKLPSDLPEGQERDDLAEELQDIGSWIQSLMQYGRLHVGGWSAGQSADEANVIARMGDAERQIGEALLALRPSMIVFAKRALHRETGLRGFVRNFAFFLRRSCIFRPCNERLDRVLKINFEDACFPYTTGIGSYKACEDAINRQGQ